MSRASSKFERLGDDVEAEVNEARLQYAAGGPVLNEELWAREESEKYEGMRAQFHLDVHADVCKTE